MEGFERMLLISQARQEALTLISKGRSRRQLLFAVDVFLESGMPDAANYLCEMLRRNVNPDEDLIQEIFRKINHYNKSERNAKCLTMTA